MIPKDLFWDSQWLPTLYLLLCFTAGLVSGDEKPVPLHVDGQRILHGPDWNAGIRNFVPSLQQLRIAAFSEPFPEGEIDFITENIGFWVPTLRLDRKVWDGSVEFGSEGTAGNSSTINFFAGIELEKDTATGLLDFDLDFMKSYANGDLTTHRTLIDLGYLWKRQNRALNWFVKGGAEYDEFKMFDVRLKVNAGIQKQFVNTEQMQLSWRIGSGVSQEIGGVDERVTPEADFGLIVIRKISDRQSLEATTDYYPEWTDFSRFRFESKAAWEVILDQEYGWSMKLSMVDRYDSTPNGRESNDLSYWILLAWKL